MCTHLLCESLCLGTDTLSIRSVLLDRLTFNFLSLTVYMIKWESLVSSLGRIEWGYMWTTSMCAIMCTCAHICCVKAYVPPINVAAAEQNSYSY